MKPLRHPTAVVVSVKDAGWMTRLRYALQALCLAAAPALAGAASARGPATRPASGADLPPAPSVVAEVEAYDADARPAAAPQRAAAADRDAPRTQPAAAREADRTPRPSAEARAAAADEARPAASREAGRRPVRGYGMAEVDAYVYGGFTRRDADDPYRLTDPMLYALPWGHPAPPPYPPPPVPPRNGNSGYGGYYDSYPYVSYGTRLSPGVDGGGGAIAVTRRIPGPPIRAGGGIIIRGGTGGGGGSFVPPGGSRRPLPAGVPIPRAAPPSLRPGT